MHLHLLGPNQVLKFFFHSGQAPLGVRSSIHTAAARAGVRVSVKVRGAVVYMWKTGTRESTAIHLRRPAIVCEVCGKAIVPRSRHRQAVRLRGQRQPEERVPEETALRARTRHINRGGRGAAPAASEDG